MTLEDTTNDKTATGSETKGIDPSITTTGEQHRGSAGPDDMMGQPISSLQRAIRNTIVGCVKSAVSRQSDPDHPNHVESSQDKPLTTEE